jgi:F0F1-type ATP synthase membrane subunit a
MVTAVVIPIICLYFYWITRKEMKLNDSKWLALAEIKKEAVVTGEIRSISTEKQRFYYHRYILVYELTLQT